MLSPARRHRLQALAAKEAAKADEFGGVRPDASVYQLQLTELKNDIHVLRSIQSQEKRAEAKKELIPKHMPYVLGIVQSGANQIKETIALWGDEIQPPISLRNAETNLKPNEVKALYIDHLRNYGYWTNTPDDSIGLEFKDGNGNSVYRTNNQKFVVRKGVKSH